MVAFKLHSPDSPMREEEAFGVSHPYLNYSGSVFIWNIKVFLYAWISEGKKSVAINIVWKPLC